MNRTGEWKNHDGQGFVRDASVDNPERQAEK